MDRDAVVRAYVAKLKEHSEVEEKVKNVRLDLVDKRKQYDKSEDHLKAQQSIGQMIGEVL